MRIKLLSVLVIALSINSFAQIGSTNVKTWADDKRAAFSFTFDDGFISHYETVRPILNNFGFKGTFYVITGSLTETLPSIWRYGTWQQFREMSAEGHEIASHTVKHPGLDTIQAGDIYTQNTLHYEMFRSKEKIEEKIPGKKVITINYPYISHNSLVDSIAQIYYEAGRSGGSTLNTSSLNSVQRFGLFSKKVEFSIPRNSPQDDADEWQDFESYVQRSIDENKWGMIMIHEVYPFSRIPEAVGFGAFYPVSSEWLTQLCQLMKDKSDANEMWVETVANIIRYSRERDSFTSTVLSTSDTLIEISATDNLNNSIYNYPLTVDIQVPLSWDTVKVIQGGNEQTVYSKTLGADNFIRAYIVPDRGNVILRKRDSSEDQASIIVEGYIKYAGSSSPVKGVTVKLCGSESDSAVTDDNGYVAFQNKKPGNFTISISSSNEWKSVTSADALNILLYNAQSIQFDSLQLAAADVNNDGKITSTDALQILRRNAGIIDNFNKPDWIFFPPSIIKYINKENSQFNASAILTGDINKSYTP